MSGYFIWNLWKEPVVSFLILNDHKCKILFIMFIIWLFKMGFYRLKS